MALFDPKRAANELPVFMPDNTGRSKIAYRDPGLRELWGRGW
jgi:hypothetical protein